MKPPSIFPIWLLIIPLCATLSAQPAAGPSDGNAAWEDSPHAADLAQQMARMQPLLEQLTPDQWLAKGAPDTYMTQWQQARKDLAAFAAAAQDLDRQPQRLTLALDAYFRLQTLEWRMDSLIDAVRTYQNPAVGDLIESVLRSTSPHRDALRAYIMNLADRKEQEFTIANNDAQSCRIELAQIPAAARRNSKASPAKP